MNDRSQKKTVGPLDYSPAPSPANVRDLDDGKNLATGHHTAVAMAFAEAVAKLPLAMPESDEAHGTITLISVRRMEGTLGR